MFSKEFFELLIQIFKSWQVIAVTIGLIIYFWIVSYTAKSYRRPRAKKVKVKVKRAKDLAPAGDSGPEETYDSIDSNDELGLEEE